MRYCLCYTIKDSEGKVSSPYIMVCKNDGIEFVPFLIKNCKNQLLLTCRDLKSAEALMKDLKNGYGSLKSLNNNYFLLKVDSLNFPFKLSKTISSKRRILNGVWESYKINDCK